MNTLRFLIAFTALFALLTPLRTPTPRPAPDLAPKPLPTRGETGTADTVPLTLVDPSGRPLVGVVAWPADAPSDADGAADVPPGWVGACGWDVWLRVAEDDTEGRLWTLPPRCPVRLTFASTPPPASSIAVPGCPTMPLVGDLDLAVDCDGVKVSINRPGHVDLQFSLDPRARPVQPVDDRPGVPLTVRVVDAAGRPIPGARVHSAAWAGKAFATGTNSGRTGTTVWLPADAGLVVVGATAEGYTDATHSVAWGSAAWSLPLDRLALPGPRPAEATVVLHRERTIRVACAGLPDDDCDIVGGATCGLWDTPRRDGNVLCPGDGPHVVRVAHRSVRVGPDDDVAWLDFRDDATLTITDPPPGARLRLLADTLRVGRTVRCDDTCVAAGLPPDRWWVCPRTSAGTCLTAPVPVDLAAQARATLTWGDLATPEP